MSAPLRMRQANHACDVSSYAFCPSAHAAACAHHAPPPHTDWRSLLLPRLLASSCAAELSRGCFACCCCCCCCCHCPAPVICAFSTWVAPARVPVRVSVRAARASSSYPSSPSPSSPSPPSPFALMPAAQLPSLCAPPPSYARSPHALPQHGGASAAVVLRLPCSSSVGGWASGINRQSPLWDQQTDILTD